MWKIFFRNILSDRQWEEIMCKKYRGTRKNEIFQAKSAIDLVIVS